MPRGSVGEAASLAPGLTGTQALVSLSLTLAKVSKERSSQMTSAQPKRSSPRTRRRSTRPANLPDFRKPPVTEVVLSIQFASPPNLRVVHAGLYWESIRSKYPKTSEQPPIMPVFEICGGVPAQQPVFQLQTVFGYSMPRFWFESTEGDHLVQLQQDRILHNWRRRSPEMEYPRYERLRENFVAEIDKLSDLFHRERIGEIQPNQCEVTYINTISLPEGTSVQQHLSQVTPLWAGNVSEPYLPDAENTTIQARYVLHKEGAPYGRLYVNFTPAFLTTDYSPVIRLEITVRGKPASSSIPAAFNLLDEGRKVIVEAFAAVTTPAMHKEWGRTDVI